MEYDSYPIGVPMGGEDRSSLSTDSSSYDGVFPSFHPILNVLLYYFFVFRWSSSDSSHTCLCY